MVLREQGKGNVLITLAVAVTFFLLVMTVNTMLLSLLMDNNLNL